MRFIRKLFFSILTILFVLIGIFFYNRATDGFSIRQMTSSLPSCPQFEVAILEDEKEKLRDLLDQTFHYIGKGCQFYAFESEDGKYVLKFLKHKHLRQCLWLKSLPMPLKLRKICDAKISRRQERVERLFSSCQLAYEKMRTETGLLFIHLNRIPSLDKKVIIKDKLGLKHQIALDEYEYVLQKKGQTVKEAFSQLSASEIPKKIEQLIDLVKERQKKGICDRDRSFVQNVAFSMDGKRAFFIDIGQFYEDSVIFQEDEQTTDLKKRLGNLRSWTARYFPDFLQNIETN